MNNKNRKLFISFFAALVLVLASFFVYSLVTGKITFGAVDEGWDGVSVASSFDSGNGTEENPYIIDSAEEFIYFKELIEGDHYKAYQDKYYALGDDINLGDKSLSSIGVIKDEEERIFKGYFDGRGYSINNIKIDKANTVNEASYYSLFTKTVDAHVTNLVIDTFNIVAEESLEKVVIGSIVGDSYISLSEEEFEKSEEEYLSSFNDISINGLVVDISKIESSDNNISLLINDISLGVSVNNISIYGEIKGNKLDNNIGIFYNNLGDVSNVISSINLEDIDDVDFSNDKINNQYIVKNNKIYIGDKEVSSDDVLKEFNDKIDDKYYWEFTNNRFIISTYEERNDDNTSNESRSFSFSIQNATTIELHDTGTTTNAVYINDLTSDYNHYMGINYTGTSGNAIPDGTSSNTYSDSNLVKVYIRYNGRDFRNSSTYGTVSVDEAYSDIYYYKYYPIVDGKVSFQLIDNPWANRPNGRAFNGWVTDYEGANISLDMDDYTREVSIPVSSSSNIVQIEFKTNWTTATTVTSSSFSNLKNSGMVEYEPTVDRVYEDVSSYYLRKTVGRYRNYPTGALNSSGSSVAGNYCNTWGGCTYYILNDTSDYASGTTYYEFNGTPGSGNFSVHTVTYTETITPYFQSGTNMAGEFERITVSNGGSLEGLYDNTGNLLSNSCTQSSCTAYKLLQYYDDSGNPTVSEEGKNYYYVVTRDTNIMALSSDVSGGSITISKPVTITGINNGVKSEDAALNIGSNSRYILLNNDARIEHITIRTNREESANITANSYNYAAYSVIGNFNNLKLGRGIEVTSRYGYSGYKIGGVYGGTSLTDEEDRGSSNNPMKYSLIVESGQINNVYFTEGNRGEGTIYMYGQCTLGNDIDRVKGDNTSLDIYYSVQGTHGYNTYYSGANNPKLYDTYVKSGSYGTSKSGLFSGIYVGGRGGTVYGNRTITVEGGYIYSLIGGLGVPESEKDKNVYYINIKGGSVDAVFGGSGSGTCYGNRIINLSGGTINYSVFGGSNGSNLNEYSEDSGIMQGDSFIYAGGSATVGSESDTLFGAESGSIFGAGAGTQDKDGVGSVNNSRVVIGPEITINKNVYGGGNYGSVGSQSTASTCKTNVDILGGTIKGSVYGGGNNNGSGSDDSTSTITINVHNGTLEKSVYGGSRTNGLVYGSTNVNILGGKITSDVYGGGEGGYTNNNNQGTYVRDNVEVVVDGGTISGSVYGGSAYGSVNASRQNAPTSTNTTKVTINGGTITNNVFGGGKGSSSYTPQVAGPITVTVNGGTIGKVFGGFDASGKPHTSDVVYLNGGTIGSAFGGGNNANQDTTDIRLQGSTITGNLYGGSNLLGTVTESNVLVTSGSVVDIFGGNNEAGLTITTNVTVNGGTITGDIYGGGMKATSTTSNVTVNSHTVGSVYGGGKQAGLTTSNVTMNSATATSVYGGSNVSGDVVTSNVTINTSNITDVYGGNNQGGTTTTSNVEVNNNSTNTLTNVYGGGMKANTTTSNIDINSGKITNVYGGGNQAGVTTTNVNIHNGDITNVFGGSNSSGVVTTAKVNVGVDDTNPDIKITNLYGGNNLGGSVSATQIKAKAGNIDTIYGGGNKAQVGSTNVVVDGVTASVVYGAGNAANVTGNTYLDIDNSTISSNVFGGGNEGVVNGNTEVFITDTTILENAFAGGNGSTAIVKGNSTITIDGDTVVGSSSTEAPSAGCVFASGNAANTGMDGSNSVATLNIVGGTIYGNVYGGAKMAIVYGTTDTNIGSSAVNNNSLKEDDLWIKGTVFGGGESNASGSDTYDWNFVSVTNGIDVNIDGSNYSTNNHKFVLNGSIFGSGNASSSSGESNIYIKNLGTRDKPNKNISIQRTTNCVIDSSVLELEGTTDRTNELSDFKYSFNIIDKLTIKNNTVLLLQHNANLLKNLYSGVDVNGSLVPATVDIDDENKTVTKNVDNRIYMVPSQNLHVAINESATAYGRVTGMTFFGMYTGFDNGNYRYGLYDDDLDYGDSGNAGLEIVGGSYVIGLHHTDHDITKDGFYTNELNDEYTEVKTKYIDPSTIGETGYRWIVGFEALNYEFTLKASKFASLGTYELQLIDFAKGDTEFNVIGFDSSGLNSGISLVDSTLVPRVGATQAEADSILGLSMKAETQEWTGYGTTKLLGRNGGDFTGDKQYKTDSRAMAPSLMFYLYHAKNMIIEGDLGTVILTLEAVVPKNQIEFDIKFITVTINIDASPDDDVDAYDASITYDKKYEMPSTTSVNITNQSQFTAYFAMIIWTDNFNSVYGRDNDNYHVLTTNNPLPEGTMITMLDYGASTNRPEYYYFEVTHDVYTDSVNQMSQYNEASYKLSDFIKMDSTSTDNTYSDSEASQLYFHEDQGLVDEEFIFIVDFKETNVTGEHLNNTILLEMRNNEDRTVYNVLGVRERVMNYNTFDTSNIVLSQTFSGVDEYLYYDIDDSFSYTTKIGYNQTDNLQSIIDTNYESSKMGLNVTLFDKDGVQVSSSLLLGASVTFDNQQYFADGDGVFRIKLANKVSNLNKTLKFTVDENLPVGKYVVRYTLFASDDGLHNSNYENSVTKEFNVEVVSSDNSISVDVADLEKVVDGETGLNLAGTKNNSYTVKYSSKLSNPNFRVEVLKRDVSAVNSNNYISIPFNNLFTNRFSVASGNEVYINMDSSEEKTFDFHLNDELTSGTYRIEFRLYDNDQVIDTDRKYVIVKKKTD